MLAYLYVVLAVVVRFLPHPLNFTPVGASLLFFGARRPLRQMWIPVALLAAADVVLTRRYGYSFGADYLITWAWYAGAVALGSLLRTKVNLPRLVGASLALSVSFFVLSNLAVWASGAMYPLTGPGLVTCYVAALPFFRNTLAGDLVFTGVAFGLPVLSHLLRPRTAAV